MRTTPDLAAISPEHLDASKNKDYLWSWNQDRNVIDQFKQLPDEEIRNRLKQTAFPYAVCIENWLQDFNIGTCIRNANAFNAKEIFYLGEKRFDRRSSVGVQAYTELKFLRTVDEFMELKKRYTIIGVDNISGSVPIDDFQYPENPLFVFGGEGPGLTPGMQQLCDHMIMLEQFGSVRSLNAGTASGIVMHDFVSKFRKNNRS